MQTKGWDFVTLPGSSSPVNLSTMDLKILCLTIKKVLDTSLCSIQDTFTGEVVFQLPAQFGSFGKSVVDMHCGMASI